MPAPLKRSGLQNEVISLYRQCFRAAREKPVVKKKKKNAESINHLKKKTPFRKLDPVFMHLFVKNSNSIISNDPILPLLNIC